MKFHSKPIEEHTEAPLADDGQWEEIVDHWDNKNAAQEGQNHCYVASIVVGRGLSYPEAQLQEILGLVRTQGDEVVGYETSRLFKPDPRTFLGRGLSKEITERALEHGANLLVIDAELSPSQTRNLEDLTGLAVCDREAVILNVFLRQAKTRSARIQVEIAHLEYLRPRIRGLGLDMDQQSGGVMLGRGPGETMSELLARRLDGRLAELRKAFVKIQRARTTQSKRRSSCKRIALLGYTNAGKTSLMNALTRAELSVRDAPFETLDTTSRALTRYGGDVLLSDTVGFIRRLPERLFQSFASTLAEIKDASLLMIVVDASDLERTLHVRTIEAMLAKLGAAHVPRLYVFNKLDQLERQPPNGLLSALAHGHAFTSLSSHDKNAVAQLKRSLIRTVRNEQTKTVFVPYESTEVIASVYAQCRVIETESLKRGLRFTLEGEPHILEQIDRSRRQV